MCVIFILPPTIGIYCVSPYALVDLIILDELFIKGDELYIQDYDPVNGRPQKVFMPDRTLIGTISSDKYWEIEKMMIRLVNESSNHRII